ncbi:MULTISPECIES: hypothetical protein [Thalassospira]|uniref:Uncharacterized protein n=2 Tax=Thalassospira TaxID=168934 RepID=A0A367W8I8_9PROT|nr:MULTISPECIES: hypothetical protein [Thalassospira]MDG4717971.1 hypothetical protein [Thalassospira sp. FZY0004]RCK37755.1 hypothetical protein TH19_06855 [Thalassospira profundimaris]
MSKKNRHGLSRTIPEEVKREIRQRSKFGCVVCRQAIYTYEHILPCFVDATEHNPDNMCLLCPNHQRDSTDGVLSKAIIQNAYEQIQKSNAPLAPNRHNFFNLTDHPTAIVEFGPTSFHGFQSIINIDGKDLLCFSKSENLDQFLNINAQFFDSSGQRLFSIKNNEWIGNHRSWDIDFVGRRLTIRRRLGDVIFSAEKLINSNTIRIEKIDMWIKPFHIYADKKQFKIGQINTNKKQYVYYGIHAQLHYGKCGVFLDSQSTNNLAVGQLKIYGGNAIITGTGINLGRGDGYMIFKEMRIDKTPNVPILIEPRPIKRKEHQIFVTGHLQIKKLQFSSWEEEEYYLDGMKLISKPSSWGVITPNTNEELFHIAGSEQARLENLKGFVGYWADDLLNQSWADRVFECEVKSDEHLNSTVRVKRSKISGREVVRETSPEDNKWFYPHKFAGVPVWKE